MEPLNDSLNVQGTVSFEPQGEFVAIAGTLSHFSPGAHAFHVHEDAGPEIACGVIMESRS